MATIDLIVLGILKKEPMGAYDIQKLVEYRNISKWVKISTPSIYKKAALTMGAQKQQMYRYVIFPACLPELISGLKQGWSFAWRALMAGEVMTTSLGLGQTLIMGRDLADINQVMLVMIVIILIGMLIDKCVFSVIEKQVMRKRE